MPNSSKSGKTRDRIIDIALDDTALAARSCEIEHERRVAIFDLLEDNHFRLMNGGEGPYRVRLAVGDRGVLLNVCDGDDAPLQVIEISLRLLRRNIRDYFMICETYFDAIKSGEPTRIEAIDHTRRALHSESGTLLQTTLADEATLDLNTARRLFTLISVLHMHR